MKLIITCILVGFTGLWPGKPAAKMDITQALHASLCQGDAGRLSAQFAKTIALVIDAEEVDFPSVEATHAELILRAFFRRYPPHGFQFVHRGASEHLRYSTGTYQTGGQTFSVYVLMRQTSNHEFVIDTLQFRKEQTASYDATSRNL